MNKNNMEAENNVIHQSIYEYLQSKRTTQIFAKEIIDYILDSQTEPVIKLFQKVWQSEDYRHSEKRLKLNDEVNRYLIKIRKDLLIIYQKAKNPEDIEELKEYYDKLHPRKCKKKVFIELYDCIQEGQTKYSYAKEIIDYILDKKGYCVINYNSKTCIELEENKKRSFYKNINVIRKELNTIYEEVSNSKDIEKLKKVYDKLYFSKNSQKNKIIYQTIYEFLQTDKIEFRFAKEIIDYILDIQIESVVKLFQKAWQTEDYRNSNSMVRLEENEQYRFNCNAYRIRNDLTIIYKKAKNPEDIEELKEHYDKLHPKKFKQKEKKLQTPKENIDKIGDNLSEKYKVINIEELKKIDDTLKIENILLNSSLVNELQKIMPLKIAYAIILYQPWIVGKFISLKTIAHILQISEEEVHQYILEAQQLINQNNINLTQIKNDNNEEPFLEDVKLRRTKF